MRKPETREMVERRQDRLPRSRTYVGLGIQVRDRGTDFFGRRWRYGPGRPRIDEKNKEGIEEFVSGGEGL